MSLLFELLDYQTLLVSEPNVSLFDLVGAYSTFINKGIWTEPFFISRIEDKYGNLIQEFIPTKQEALSEETAYLP